MEFWLKIKEFVENYQPHYFINLLNRVIKKIQETIANAGNGFWRFLLIFPLFILILLLWILIIFKKFFTNLWDIIKFIFKFFRKLTLTILEELDFYWLKLKNSSKELLKYLIIINKKLYSIIEYQINKLGNDAIKYDPVEPNNPMHEMLLMTLFYILNTVFWLALGTLMSILLIFGFATLFVPFFHKLIRINVFNASQEEPELVGLKPKAKPEATKQKDATRHKNQK